MQRCDLSRKISAINPKINMVLLTAYDEIKNNSLNLETVKKPITHTNLANNPTTFELILVLLFLMKTIYITIVEYL
jgi:hypothetical protein